MTGDELQAAIDDTPAYKSAHGAQPYYGNKIELSPHQEIVLTKPIVIGKNDSVRICSPVHSSVRIVAPGNWPCFVIEPGHRVAQLDGLFLDGGGVEYIGGVNKHWGISNSTIADAGVAVRLLGRANVGGLFDSVYFRRNSVNVECLQGQNNLNVFNRCFFLETQGSVGIELATTHTTFRDCSWERSKGKATVHLIKGNDPSSVGSWTTFDNCRWGPEKPVPDYCLDIDEGVFNVRVTGDLRGHTVSESTRYPLNMWINYEEM